jgi:hypothetical protein
MFANAVKHGYFKEGAKRQEVCAAVNVTAAIKVVTSNMDVLLTSDVIDLKKWYSKLVTTTMVLVRSI